MEDGGGWMKVVVLWWFCGGGGGDGGVCIERLKLVGSLYFFNTVNFCLIF
ncbi:hypothetical protein HanOQP8_Chr03g0127011 [Helianthus annuus]|nr:hypothetical protein HanOQP8_Chr03g0127011 [Helianthus annuus]